jgi:bifunctional DNA-binding transcriptional regulator/antitoxin component of YhaV-PrlF toxin-antitoxin module
MTNRALVRLRDRNQVTLPAEVISRLGIEVGGWLELTLSDSNCVQLRPAQIVIAGTPEAEQLERSAAENVRRKNYSTFRSVEEFDHHLDRIEKADVMEPAAPGQPAALVEMLSAMHGTLREELKQKVMSAVEVALREESK